MVLASIAGVIPRLCHEESISRTIVFLCLRGGYVWRIVRETKLLSAQSKTAALKPNVLSRLSYVNSKLNVDQSLGGPRNSNQYSPPYSEIVTCLLGFL